MIRFRRRRLIKKPIPFVKLFPNVVTLFGLIVGVNSLRFAFESMWENSLYCVLIATIIDGIDGRVARFLNATSHFGAELDSLCDLVNFGLCPAIIIYLWSFEQDQFKIISWAVVMFFMVCMAIRLARFNTTISSNNNCKTGDYFFQGVPAPTGAMLALIPIILDFQIGKIFDVKIAEYLPLVYFYIVCISLLVASRLPTFSMKKIQVKPEYLSLVMMGLAITMIAIYIYTWYFLPIAGILYLISIPFCIYASKRN